MYTVMFYVGLILTVAGIVLSIIIFIKDKIIDSIKTLMRLFLFGVLLSAAACTMTVVMTNDMVYSKTLEGPVTAEAENDADDDELIIGEIRYTDRDNNVIEPDKTQGEEQEIIHGNSLKGMKLLIKLVAKDKNEDEQEGGKDDAESGEGEQVEEKRDGKEDDEQVGSSDRGCDEIREANIKDENVTNENVTEENDKDETGEDTESREDIKIYIRIPGMEDRHSAVRYIDENEYSNEEYWYEVQLFTEEWSEYGETVYDGILEIVIEDKSGKDTLYETAHIVYEKSVKAEGGGGGTQGENGESIKKEENDIDITKPDINIYSDKKSGKWSKDDVTLYTYITDEDSGLKNVTYYVDGEKVRSVTFNKEIKSYDYPLVVRKSAEKSSGYYVEVTAADCSGNISREKYKVYIDKKEPKLVLSGVVSHKHYSSEVRLNLKLNDISYREAYAEYYITRRLDGMSDVIKRAKFKPRSNGAVDSFTLTDEGSYSIYAVAVDGAGNAGRSETVSFVIDRTAPEVTIRGIQKDSVSNKRVALTFGCVESFYETNDIKVKVKRTIDGKTFIDNPDIFERNEKYETEVYEFTSEGRYVVEMSAADRAGNTSGTATVSFTIDRTSPRINIIGTDAYKQWAEDVSLSFVVRERNYDKMKIKLTGYRTDMDGDKHEVAMHGTDKRGRVIRWKELFTEDGIYSIYVNAVDRAGNEERKKISFVIDKTAPVIGEIEAYNGKYLKNFCLKDVVNSMFADLTMLSCKMLLNGMEYDGIREITEEGKYSLYVDAVDELGHRTTKTSEFIIDHTPPVVIFEGVKNGETVYKKGEVSVKTDDPQDMITKIIMNGKEIDAESEKLSYNEYGDYHIEVDSVDMAGNVGHEKLDFVYENRRDNTRKSIVSSDTQAEDIDDSDLTPIVAVVVSIVFLAIVCVGIYLCLGTGTENIET